MGARPGSIEEQVLRRDVGYQSEFVDIDAATSADNPAAGAAARAPLDTPPPTLPTHPTSYTTPSLDTRVKLPLYWTFRHWTFAMDSRLFHY